MTSSSRPSRTSCIIGALGKTIGRFFAIQRLWARRRSTQPTGVTFVMGEGGTVEALDSIASFVKSQIPTPPGHRDSIDSLLHDDQHPLPWASKPDNLGEIRRTFLAGNRHFTM